MSVPSALSSLSSTAASFEASLSEAGGRHSVWLAEAVKVGRERVRKPLEEIGNNRAKKRDRDRSQSIMQGDREAIRRALREDNSDASHSLETNSRDNSQVDGFGVKLEKKREIKVGSSALVPGSMKVRRQQGANSPPKQAATSAQHPG